MTAETYIVFNADEIRKHIPFQLVAETMSREIWNTTRRKHRMKEEFTEAEIEATYKMHRQAREWYLYKGVPEELRLRPKTLQLWWKLAEFCMSL